ncbi:hypothetical protein V6Z12_D09G059300 [Gossypium hirsutum]
MHHLPLADCVGGLLAKFEFEKVKCALSARLS